LSDVIPEYAKTHTLLIPESLYAMDDAYCVMAYGEAAIFYKNIAQSMVDIDFFTNTPCLAFVLSGEETFSSYDNDEIILSQGQMLLMPKDSFMVSDFLRTDGPLEAFLFFFDDFVINEFLKSKKHLTVVEDKVIAPFKLGSDRMASAYMEALFSVYMDVKATPDLLRIKLLELLNILDLNDKSGKMRQFLRTSRINRPKRNIKRLLADPCHWKLNVTDLAKLSGRAPTSFNRDFQRQFGTTPQKWLISARLEKAHGLLETTSLSVSEIALEVGYENISHFISVFKKKYGMSPKKMRLEKNW